MDKNGKFSLMKNNPIGVYDSGIGGLTVLNTLRHQFPHENFIYFGDTAHLPYGTKSQDQLISFAHKIIGWMEQEKNVKAVVAACHTSSALALEEIKPYYSFPLTGTINPLIKALARYPTSQKIGILVTPASAQSRTHEKVLRKAGFCGDILTIACPEFVPLIEAGKILSHDLRQAAHLYLQPFLTQKFDTLIYGCTHYPLVGSLLRSLLPPETTFIDPAEFVAMELQTHLTAAGLLAPAFQKGGTSFYCSLDPLLFQYKLNSVFSLCAPVHLQLWQDPSFAFKKAING